jgi:hypothetical protein
MDKILSRYAPNVEHFTKALFECYQKGYHLIHPEHALALVGKFPFLLEKEFGCFNLKYRKHLHELLMGTIPEEPPLNGLDRRQIASLQNFYSEMGYERAECGHISPFAHAYELEKEMGDVIAAFKCRQNQRRHEQKMRRMYKGFTAADALEVLYDRVLAADKEAEQRRKVQEEDKSYEGNQVQPSKVRKAILEMVETEEAVHEGYVLQETPEGYSLFYGDQEFKLGDLQIPAHRKVSGKQIWRMVDMDPEAKRVLKEAVEWTPRIHSSGIT